MRINTKKGIDRKKLALSAIVGALLVGALALTYTETHRITNIVKNPFYRPTHVQSQSEQAESKTKNDPTTDTTKAQPADGVSKSQTTTDVPVSQATTVNIVQLNETGGSVNISASITNPGTSGTCTFTFSAEGTRPVVGQSTELKGTCSTSIPSYQFSMIGDWQVKVNYFSNNTVATATGSISIQ